MSTLLFGQLSNGDVPASEDVIRGTATPVHQDAPAAEAAGAPEFNEVETDRNPDIGMTTRQLASDWHEPEKYRPWWQPQVDGQTEHNAAIDRQVSTSGTAAAREAAGEQGHGSMAYAVGIEPTLREGAAFGNDYFAADKPEGINTSNKERGVQPTMVSRDDVSALAAYGNVAARDAAAAGTYAAWYSDTMGG
jgi:hypothetical protein